jgi:hypothetical protein
MRRIFRPNMRDVTEDWKELHDDVNTLHLLPDPVMFLKGSDDGE